MFSAVCWLDFLLLLFVANTKKKKVEYTEVTKI